MKDAMTPNQHARAAELIEQAKKALLMASREDLGLNAESWAALAATQSQLEDFRLFVLDQPRKGELL